MAASEIVGAQERGLAVKSGKLRIRYSAHLAFFESFWAAQNSSRGFMMIWAPLSGVIGVPLKE